jgi:hypothetical protein
METGIHNEFSSKFCTPHGSRYQIIADSIIIISIVVTSFVGLDPSDLRIVAGHASSPFSHTALSLLQLGPLVWSYFSDERTILLPLSSTIPKQQFLQLPS